MYMGCSIPNRAVSANTGCGDSFLLTAVLTVNQNNLLVLKYPIYPILFVVIYICCIHTADWNFGVLKIWVGKSMRLHGVIRGVNEMKKCNEAVKSRNVVTKKVGITLHNCSKDDWGNAWAFRQQSQEWLMEKGGCPYTEMMTLWVGWGGAENVVNISDGETL